MNARTDSYWTVRERRERGRLRAEVSTLAASLGLKLLEGSAGRLRLSSSQGILSGHLTAREARTWLRGYCAAGSRSSR